MTNNKSSRVLLSFVGFHDPFSSSIDGQEHEGPVLSLLRGKAFDAVVVIGTPNTKDRTEKTLEAIKERFPDVSSSASEIELVDPTDYFEILPGLRNLLTDVRSEHEDATFFIGTASGTPQMHACWLMLVASGELPARLLQIRPPKFVSADKPPITEIDPGGRDFPIVKQNVWGVNESKTAYSTDRIIVQSLGIIGDHPALKNAIEKTCNLAKSNEPVLILGESGTGKELFAKLVHKCSERRDKPFVSLNCSAIPSDLAESTLFGHKKGGFTGAAGDRAGKFREADGGTIFLDELGELPLTLQAKLLRTIEQGEIEPVGGTTESVNVRVVAATNRKLSVEYQENDFRQDLYFRLCVGEVTLPALRDRRTDINKLALSFLDNFCETLRKRKTLSPEAMIKIESYSWPGNVRELSNVIKRAVLMSRETEISEEQIEVNLQSAHASLKFLPTPEPGFDLNKYIDLVRAELYSKAMTLGTDQKGAAALLGLSPPAVSQYLSKQKRTD